MAACGGIEHIFEKAPLSEAPMFLEALSPWKHMKNPGVDDPSFTEIFGELHFKEALALEPPPPSPSTVDQEISSRRGKGYYHGGGDRKHNGSLSLCTEGLGFESCDDVEETTMANHHHPTLSTCKQGEGGDQEAKSTVDLDIGDHVGRDLQSPETSRRGFPPPISSIGRSGKPWVWFKSYREDGRFILREIKIPTQELLHACRQDGRLKLQFMHSDDHDGVNRHSQEEEEDEDQQEHVAE